LVRQSVLVKNGFGADVALEKLEPPGSEIVLNDRGDATADDEAFSGTTTLDYSGISGGQCLTFVAQAENGAGVKRSEPYELCVTRFRIALDDSDTSAPNIIPDFVDPRTPTRAPVNVLANELLLFAKPTAAECVLVALASSLGGPIVGGIPQAKIFQLLLDTAVDTDGLRALLGQARLSSAIVFAEPVSTLGGAAACPPNPAGGTGIQGSVKATDVVPWTDGAGVTVGVVGTGVRATHNRFSAAVTRSCRATTPISKATAHMLPASLPAEVARVRWA
jgi:hypothetical protein